jgi:hypothetical protein
MKFFVNIFSPNLLKEQVLKIFVKISSQTFLTFKVKENLYILIFILFESLLWYKNIKWITNSDPILIDKNIF